MVVEDCSGKQRTCLDIEESDLLLLSQTAVCTRVFECLGSSRRTRPARSTESYGSVGELQENAKVCRRCMRVRCG